MKRNFCLGSEWLYYKIYTGVQSANVFLTEQLYPVILELQQENILVKWFFIRYKDPEEHLRIRFLVVNPQNLTAIISKLHDVFDELLKNNIIWKVQTDTYQREIERYGENTIENSESIFCFDSEMILQYLLLKPYFEKTETQLLFSFLAVDCFLNSFGLTNLEKMNLLEQWQLSFKTEFNADKILKKELDKNFRELFQDMNDFIIENSKEAFSELYDIIAQKQNLAKNVIESIKENLQIPLSSFLSSHVHMMINRQFTSKQLKYELLIYDHLYRYYKAINYKI
jgi:thiopeptide-type bacteriocin biosynthesis protein